MTSQVERKSRKAFPDGEEHNPSQSSIDSASLDLSYSRSSLNSSSSDTFQEEIIACGDIVEPYQYEPVESKNRSSQWRIQAGSMESIDPPLS